MRNLIYKVIITMFVSFVVFIHNSSANVNQYHGNNISNIDTADISDEIFTSSKNLQNANKTGAFGEFVNQSSKGVEVVPNYIRKPKNLDKDFSGYKIELMTVYNNKLSLNDELYTKFGGIKIEQRTANSYTYLIGDFKDKEACEDYYTKVIQSQYNKAKCVKYKEGIIVKFK